MTRDWKYILYISLAFGAFLALKLLSPRQHNWAITFAAEDKNPFGGYVLNALMPTIFPSGEVRHSFKTLYELTDSVGPEDAIFIVTQTFTPGKEDVDVLLNHVSSGGNAFISAQYVYGIFADTLKLSTYDTGFKHGDVLSQRDSATLRFASIRFDTTERYVFRQTNVNNYISNFDTTRTSVIAVNEYNAPVTIRMRWGKGDLFFNSTPMMFTNIYMLAAGNKTFVSSTLSYLPDRPVTWTEYYHRGRREISTPLRFVLLSEPLSWAYYVTLGSILVFMAFEMKRRQRIIPVMNPLANTTLEFVSTIGDLYFQSGNHKSVAEKKINYFLEQVRSKHGLATNKLDSAFASALARKADRDEAETAALTDLMQRIREADAIKTETLVDLNARIESFHMKS